jgi:hypothetical protein
VTTNYYPDLQERVRQQATDHPDLYGRIDFDEDPYRFTTDPEVESALPTWVAERAPVLADDRLVELAHITTMLGDVVADPYAALADTYGVRGLAAMVKTACKDGIDAVPDAPDELRAFIGAMEATPAWVDLDLVEEGARFARIPAAFLSPFVTRGVFLATFLNTYSALPMALTGALSGRRAAHRINDTTSFFAVTTLPGALRRHGPGFEAAAMVRLMHSVVRCQAMARPERWDISVYGMPVPQIDQMPAGMVAMYLLALRAQRRNRHEFNERERAMLEFSRYRCFLLGLPEELLPTTPAGVIDVFHGRAACLRDDFDDTCRRLVDATMAAYLRPRDTRLHRSADAVERSWSKISVLRIVNRDRNAAAAMGVTIERGDLARVALTAPFILGRFIAVTLASRIPGLRRLADTYTTRTVRKRLANYGKPEFIAGDPARPTPA